MLMSVLLYLRVLDLPVVTAGSKSHAALPRIRYQHLQEVSGRWQVALERSPAQISGGNEMKARCTEMWTLHLVAIYGGRALLY